MKINKTNSKITTNVASVVAVEEKLQKGPEKGQKGTENADLDLVLRSDKKLAHPTAERVKAPKRRPPSSSFQKEAVS